MDLIFVLPDLSTHWTLILRLSKPFQNAMHMKAMFAFPED